MTRLNDVDVLVIGGGNAGLCAALAAQECGARVLVLDKAPAGKHGGNSFVTAGAFRWPYRGMDDLADVVSDRALKTPEMIDVGQYTEEEFFADLQRVTRGKADPQLSRILVRKVFPTMRWLHLKGVDFVLAYDRQSYILNGRHTFWGGLIVKTRHEGPGLIKCLARRLQDRSRPCRLWRSSNGSLLGEYYPALEGTGHGRRAATRLPWALGRTRERRV